jgi:CAAX prenyl protease-like protein
MNRLMHRVKASPLLARVVPFVVFLLLTSLQGQFGEASKFWFYCAKTIVGGWLLWSLRDAIREMKWAFSWEAVAVGVAVFVMWVGIDPFMPGQKAILVKLGLSKPPTEPLTFWNPLAHFTDASALGWLFVVVRILGSSIVVPPLEEVFYRSFLYRWIAKPDFESLPLRHFAWKPFLITAVVFGVSHEQWLAGILCGFAYQGLVIWKGRLGDAMTAHGITNLLLGLWVVWKGAWHFW